MSTRNTPMTLEETQAIRITALETQLRKMRAERDACREKIQSFYEERNQKESDIAELTRQRDEARLVVHSIDDLCAALRAERDEAKRLVASYEALSAEVGTEFEGVDEIKDVIRLLKSERDGLAAFINSHCKMTPDDPRMVVVKKCIAERDALTVKLATAREALNTISKTEADQNDSDRSSADSYSQCPLCGATGEYDKEVKRHKTACPIAIANVALSAIDAKGETE